MGYRVGGIIGHVRSSRMEAGGEVDVFPNWASGFKAINSSSESENAGSVDGDW